MNAIYLILVVVGLTTQAVAKKEYNRRYAAGKFTFSACVIAVAMLFFVFCLRGGFEIDGVSVGYAVAFAVTFALANLTSFLAVMSGPLSLTALFTSYSLLIPTIYGLVALGEKVTAFLIIGLLLLIVSIYMSNYEKSGEEKKISAKWVVYVLLNFLTNGICTTVQKVQQSVTGGLYKNEFMIIALAIATLFLLAVALLRERKEIVPCIKTGFVFYVICGIATGVLNLLVMVLSATMPASIMFPIISGGGIILSTAVSLLVYKEKLSRIQLVGVCIGIMSVVFLNI